MAILKFKQNQKSVYEKISDIFKEYPALEDKNFCAMYYFKPFDKQEFYYYDADMKKTSAENLNIATKEYIDSILCPYIVNSQKTFSEFHIGTSQSLFDEEVNDYFKQTTFTQIGKININKYTLEYSANNEALEPVYEKIYEQMKSEALKIDLQTSLALNQNVISLLKECGYLSIGVVKAQKCNEKQMEALANLGFSKNGNFFIKPFKAFPYSIDDDTTKTLRENEIMPEYWNVETLRAFAKNYAKRKTYTDKTKELLQGLNSFFKNFVSKLTHKELLQAKNELIDKFVYPSINDAKNYILNDKARDNYSFAKEIKINYNDSDKNETLQDINYLFLINNLSYNLEAKILNKNNTQEYFSSLKDDINESLMFLEKSLKHIDAREYKNNILKLITNIHSAIRSFETNAVNVVDSQAFNDIVADYNKIVGAFVKKYCDKNEKVDFNITISHNGDKINLSSKLKNNGSKFFDSVIRAITGEKANEILETTSEDLEMIATQNGNFVIEGIKNSHINNNPNALRSFFNQNFINEVKNKEAKLIINFIGAPGVGKSYTAAKIVELLGQKLGKKVPLIREVAKGIILQDKQELLKDQIYVTSEQIAREKESLMHSPIAGTDSPAMQGKFYISDLSQSDELDDMIKENEKNRLEINIFIKHNEESLNDYSQEGRIHNKEQSLEIEHQMIEKYKDKNFIFIDRSFSMDDILEKIIKTPEYQLWEQNNIDNEKMYLNTDNKQNIIAYRFRELVNNLDFKEMSPEQLATKTAVALALTTGFLGSVNYSTLQHSLNVCKIVANKIKDNPEFKNLDKREILLKALFHDAVEALIMGDIPTPIKNTMQNYYAEEEKYIKEIYAKLGIKNTNYDSIIDWADKTERNTFMLIYFSNSDNLVNAVDIYLQHLQQKLNFVLDKSEKTKMARNILNEYINYLEYGDTPMLGNTTLDFIETFRLKNNSGALTRAEFDKFGLSMQMNAPVEKILMDFAKVARTLGLDISNEEVLQELNSINDLPETTYKLDKMFQIEMAKDALRKIDLQKHDALLVDSYSDLTPDNNKKYAKENDADFIEGNYFDENSPIDSSLKLKG